MSLEQVLLTVNKHPIAVRIKTWHAAKQSVLVVTIHDNTLSIVEMKGSPSGKSIGTIYEVSLPEDCYLDSHIIDQTKLSQFIKTSCQKQGIKLKHVVFISDDPNIIIRLFSIPKHSTKWIAKHIYKKIKKYVLFSSEEVKLNWKIVETVDIDDTPHYRILVVAMKASSFRQWTSIFKQATLYLEGITTHTLGLKHAILNLVPATPQFIICLEPRHVVTLLIIKNILQHIHVEPMTQAELSTSSDAQLELKNTIQRVKERYPSVTVSYHYPCAPQHTTLPTVMKSLSVTDLHSHVSSEVEHPSYLSSLGAGNMTANHLLLVDLSQGKPYFDILMGYFMMFLGFFSVIMLSVFFLFHTHSKTIHTQIDHVKSELDATNEQFHIVNDIDTQINLTKKLIVSRRVMVQQHDAFQAAEFFTHLSGLLPNDVRLNQFKLNSEGFLVLDGDAKGPDIVFTFLQNVKKSPFFLSPELKEVIQNNTSPFVRFIIQAQLGDPDGGD